MAAATTKIGVGTAIAYAVGRSPLVLANDARFLDEMSGGRLTLGLGTGTRGMMVGWHGVTDPDAPASRMEELIPLLRRLWRLHEGPVKHRGRFYSLDITPTADIQPPLRPEMPIYTAGVNARMIEVAGRVSDGLICHPTLTGRYLHDVVRPAIERGASRTGRPAGDVALKGVIICAISDDAAQARREAAAQIAFYVAPKAYGPVMEASGFGAEAAEIQAAFARKDHKGMVDAVPGAMLAEMAAAWHPRRGAGAGSAAGEAVRPCGAVFPQLHALARARCGEHVGDHRGVRAITKLPSFGQAMELPALVEATISPDYIDASGHMNIRHYLELGRVGR